MKLFLLLFIVVVLECSPHSTTDLEPSFSTPEAETTTMIAWNDTEVEYDDFEFNDNSTRRNVIELEEEPDDDDDSETLLVEDIPIEDMLEGVKLINRLRAHKAKVNHKWYAMRGFIQTRETFLLFLFFAIVITATVLICLCVIFNFRNQYHRDIEDEVDCELYDLREERRIRQIKKETYSPFFALVPFTRKKPVLPVVEGSMLSVIRNDSTGGQAVVSERMSPVVIAAMAHCLASLKPDQSGGSAKFNV